MPLVFPPPLPKSGCEISGTIVRVITFQLEFNSMGYTG